MSVAHVELNTQIEAPAESGAATRLDLDKNIWRPGDEVPEWWGISGATCGGTCARKVEGDVITYVPVLCKRWTCDVCSYYRHAWLVRNIVKCMHERGLDRMMTLTLRWQDATEELERQRLHAAWSKLRKRIAARYPGFEFIWVIQTTQRGEPHMHCLVNCYIDKMWLKQQWFECTRGTSFMVDIERVQNAGAARYVARYVGKEARKRRQDGHAIGMHAFGTSEGVTFEEFMPVAGGWEMLTMCWRENSAWLLKHANVLEFRSVPTPRLVVRVWNGEPALADWPVYAGGQARAGPGGLLPPRIPGYRVAPGDIDVPGYKGFIGPLLIECEMAP